MADIEAERAWMRTYGIRQRAENGAESARRDAEARARAERTCAYCFHDRHELKHGVGTFPMSPAGMVEYDLMSTVVLYCRTADCVCGVHPCGRCGSRERADTEDLSVERCAGCGAEWQVSAIA